MTFDEIRFALQVNGVDKEDSETLLSYCRKSGKNFEKLDEMLIDMGYVKIFTDEFFGWDNPDEEDFDDEYFSIERIHHKHVWEE